MAGGGGVLVVDEVFHPSRKVLRDHVPEAPCMISSFGLGDIVNAWLLIQGALQVRCYPYIYYIGS